MAAVAARFGIAAGTLRTWDRRYGLGPSEHTPGAHRRYTARDVERLGVMRRLTLEGVAPAEAARVALGQPLLDVVAAPGTTVDRGQESLAATSEPATPGPATPAPATPGPTTPGPTTPAPTTPAPAPAGPESVRPGTAGPGTVAADRAAVASQPVLTGGATHPFVTDRAESGHAGTDRAAPTDRLTPLNGSGGRVLSLPGADAAVRGLGRAAMALDARTVTATVRRLVEQHGVLHTWDHVLRPVLVAVGARWAATGEGIEVEHMLSDCTAVVLRDVAWRAEQQFAPDDDPMPGRRSVLLACAPGEWHALPLHALAAGLGERGISSRTLGPATPGSALRAAVSRIGPAALFLWSQTSVSSDPTVLADVPTRRPPTAVVVGGPGWAPDRLPPGVTVAVDLPHAVQLVDAAVGA